LSSIRNLYQSARNHNVIAGILINDVISFVAFLSLGFLIIGIVWPGDIQIFLGAFFGTRFALRNEVSQNHLLRIGLLVGIVGGILSALSMTAFMISLFIFSIGLQNGYFLMLFASFLIAALIIGPIIGIILYLHYNHKRKQQKASLLDDEFFEDLKDK